MISFPVATFIFSTVFQCFIPGVTNCFSLPGTFLVSAMEIPSLRKPLSSKLIYPNCPERTGKNDSWGRLFSLLSQMQFPVAVPSCCCFSQISLQYDVLDPLRISSLSSPPHSSRQISQICSSCFLGDLSLPLF